MSASHDDQLDDMLEDFDSAEEEMNEKMAFLDDDTLVRIDFRSRTRDAKICKNKFTKNVQDASLQSIVNNTSLKWIFVGGKGGVGKTTTSCSVGALLTKTRKSVLIISTDPAHNLSDAFRQKFGPRPVKVNGFSNLFCMEIDPLENKKQMDLALAKQESAQNGTQSGMMNTMRDLMKDISGSIPGIDEAMSFAELMKSVDSMDHDVIVFDTAPTGHTLRLLSFPRTLEKTMGKLLALKSKFGGLLNMATSMMQAQGMNTNASNANQIVEKLEKTMEIV